MIAYVTWGESGLVLAGLAVLLVVVFWATRDKS